MSDRLPEDVQILCDEFEAVVYDRCDALPLDTVVRACGSILLGFIIRLPREQRRDAVEAAYDRLMTAVERMRLVP